MQASIETDHKKDNKKEKKKDKKKDQKVVLVTGLTGNTGSATLRNLLAHPKSSKWIIRGGSRDPDKAKAELQKTTALVPGFKPEELQRVQFVRFDADDDNSLRAAFVGVTAALLVLPNSVTNPTNRDLPLKKQVTAAVAEGVPHIVTITAMAAMARESELGKAMGSWVEFVEQNKKSLVDLRANFFTDNLWGQQQNIKTKNSIFMNLSGSIAHIAVEDIGAFAANVLIAGKKHVGHVYNLSGPHKETLVEIAGAASRALGREIKGILVSKEEVASAMLALGLPNETAVGAADLIEWSNKGFFTPLEDEWARAGTFKKVVGREQISTEDWFRARAQAFT